MTVSLDDMMAGLDPARRRKIEDRSAELIAEEMTLRELRKVQHSTQIIVPRELGINQGGGIEKPKPISYWFGDRSTRITPVILPLSEKRSRC